MAITIKNSIAQAVFITLQPSYAVERQIKLTPGETIPNAYHPTVILESELTEYTRLIARGGYIQIELVP